MDKKSIAKITGIVGIAALLSTLLLGCSHNNSGSDVPPGAYKSYPGQKPGITPNAAPKAPTGG
jgi:hypothetical protein